MTTIAQSALHVLQEHPQWVCYNKEKVPFTPTSGKSAKANDPATWETHQQACDAHKRNRSKYAGIGYEFLKEQGITGIDLDKCIVDGKLTAEAHAIIDRFDSYTELSPSRKGVHIWVRGSLPENLGPNPDGADRVEMYDHERYFTWTGRHLKGTPLTIEDRQETLLAFYQEIRASRKPARKPATVVPIRPSLPSADSAYGLRAMQDECAEVARAHEGSRNHQLNVAAFDLGQLIAGGELSRSTVERELSFAAEQAGLDDREIERTMRSGIEAGMQEPRSKPVKELPGEEYKPAATMGNESTNGNGHHPPAEQNDTGSLPQQAFNRTDLGNAERLVARYGKDMRYCYSMNAWLIWKKTHWQEDKDGHAERLAKKTVRTIYEEAAATPDDHERKELARHALRSESKKLIRDMLALAQSEENVPVSREELDGNSWLLNCSNGTIDLQAGTLREHRRGDLLTRCITTPYKPDAECPLWLAFLHTIFGGNTNLITFIQRALGYALTGDTSEQVFFLLYGTGRNGKSTLLEVVQGILTDYAQSAEFKAFLSRDNEGIRNDIARMNGKRLVIAKESDKGKRLAEALVKQLTGGDTITARFLHQEYFDFKPQFKLFLAANHKPEIKGTDLGIWRRVRLIPFTVTISDEEKDKDLPRKLMQEAEGILAWLVQGCLDWQRYGLGIPEEVEQATNEYREEMDMIASFIDEACVIAKNAQVGATQLYTAYKAWCEENGERYDTQTSFGTRLRERGYAREKIRTGWVYRGIGLVQKEESVTSVTGCDGFSDIFEKPPAFAEKTEKRGHNPSHSSQTTQSLLMEGEPQPTPSGSQPELSPVIASLVTTDYYTNMQHWLNKYGKPRPKKVCDECHTFSWYPYWLKSERTWGCLTCQPEIKGVHNAEGEQA